MQVKQKKTHKKTKLQVQKDLSAFNFWIYMWHHATGLAEIKNKLASIFKIIKFDLLYFIKVQISDLCSSYYLLLLTRGRLPAL